LDDALAMAVEPTVPGTVQRVLDAGHGANRLARLQVDDGDPSGGVVVAEAVLLVAACQLQIRVPEGAQCQLMLTVDGQREGHLTRSETHRSLTGQLRDIRGAGEVDAVRVAPRRAGGEGGAKEEVVMLGITRMVRRRGRSERAQLRRVRRDARCREMGLRRILAHVVAMGEVIGVDPAEHPQVRTVANLIDTARGNELFGVWPW
jgi:hypothetical protein